MSTRPPFPPFNSEIASQKARMAEDSWNSRNPEKIALAYTENSIWRNLAEFINGRSEIVDFLTRKWSKELEYRLIKEVWNYSTIMVQTHLFTLNGKNIFVPINLIH